MTEKKKNLIDKFKALSTGWKIVVIVFAIGVVGMIPYVLSGDYARDEAARQEEREQAQKESEEQAKQEEAEKAAEEQRKKENEEKNSIIDSIAAFNACEARGKQEYPFGFKLHKALGRIATESIDENTGWHFKNTVDITNAYGATAKDRTMDCTVHGTTAVPVVDSFSVY